MKNTPRGAGETLIGVDRGRAIGAVKFYGRNHGDFTTLG